MPERLFYNQFTSSFLKNSMNNNPKKVLLIATVQSHIGQFHKPLMRLLKENGWEIHVAARNNLDEKDGLQLEYPDKVFDIPFQRSPFRKRNVEAYRQLKQLLAENHYDVIHCNTPVGGIIGRLAARKYRGNRTQVYYTAHGFHFYHGGPKKNWIIYYPIEKWMSRYTDKLITINHEDELTAKKSFHCPVYRIHGVGADSKKYYPINREQQQQIKENLQIEGPVLLTVGELLPNKNQKTAIKALKILQNDHPYTLLIIAGNGSEKEALEHYAKALHVESNVWFLGYTTKLTQYLQICDVEIACSYREGLPLNLIEAMLCGKPVVASNNRGHRELIKEGINGYLVNADDAMAYAQRISDIVKTQKDYTDKALQSAEPYTDRNVKQELAHIYFD